MATAIDALGHITDSKPRSDALASAENGERDNVEAAFAMLFRVSQSVKRGRPLADLMPEIEQILVKHHTNNNARYGQGVTK